MSNNKCAICRQTKSRNDFTILKNGNTHSYCKICNAERVRQYYLTNPDKLKARNVRSAKYRQEYRKSNKDKLSNYYKEWYKRTKRYRNISKAII